MARLISRLAALGNDDYSLFLIFFPGNGLSHVWINDWVSDNLKKIGRRLGSSGVVVAPLDDETYEDFDGELPAFFGPSSKFPELGQPILAIAKILKSEPPVAKASAVLVNLAAFKDQQGLATLFDQLIAASEKPDIRLSDLKLSIPVGDLRQPQDELLKEVTGIFELKPNFFGIGINLNGMADWWHRKKRQRRAEKEMFVSGDSPEST